MNNAVTSTRNSSAVRKLTYSALYLALAMVLPFLTGQVPKIGSMLCPMHIPALLCGFMCGWPWGLAVGFLSPLLRSAIFGMPPVWVSVAMAFEMATYGAVSGWLYRKLRGRGGISGKRTQAKKPESFLVSVLLARDHVRALHHHNENGDEHEL